ncbi:UvrD-helicase domain-containing protein [Aeromicrobium duanguangcaii]|uniref:RecBCD enzyme subunit RecB n=1 Tax=Aeromicrobium duanguangcaii TaxID=2968086 RepID=A0ABY5KHU1_9ACTN|nr:UvrD-helicase domain-containing protein [Aeromicrobium duanguangcaii]MCD9153193.1 UvrD-helicase domain-containing protein [Aeromicrobium duanguangcaii]UUI70039.1 UvrD-helicase domain-containing protein [Aeromicrobium duanguangcaii]
MDLQAFDITAPLPSGTALLEASAGTGKTWTIGALVTRYVAEGVVTLPELLVITFGRAASREMRERVRDQLVAAEAALADPAAHRDGGDPLLRLLTDVPDAEVATRRARVRAALADFDGATIATTHQFCQTVLRSLGTAGDSDGSAELTDDLTELVDQIVDDLYVAKYAREDDPALSHGQARALAHAVVADPHAALVPLDADPDSPAGVRVRFAEVVRRRLDQRKRELGLLDYDDLLKRLESVLEDPDSPARALMRDRWRVVLVDEFQDTDPVQWNVLHRAFGGVATLVLIGDPKQAIYAFRGGDVHTYLRAAATATERRTLPVNWRSDAPLVEALGATFAGAQLGHPDIAVRPVRAQHAESRLRDLPRPAAFRLRVMDRDGAAEPHRDLAVAAARSTIVEDLAADVAEVLASSASFDSGPDGVRPLAAGDIAVLVATGVEADLVRRTFERHGIPAVLGGGSNVLRSSAADDWLTLLEAMESPQRSGLVRAAGLTDLLGQDATTLVVGGDELTDRIATRVRDLADLLAARGVAAVVESLTDEAFAARILARPDGYRRMTDLRHVAHLLHEVALREHLGLSGLVQWLRRQRSESGDSAELTRRLDSDAKAVQVLTIHASKGLEFPVVYLPFLFNRWRPDREERPRFHDASGQRFLDVGGSGHPAFAEHSRAAQAEDAGEVLRLAYVAMTRAKSQLVAWWAPTRDARNSGLHRLLFRPDPARPDVPEVAPVPDDATALSVLRGWQDRDGPSLERVVPRAGADVSPADAPCDLAVRPFDRELDTAWRRTSYSGLIRAEQDAPHVGSEPETEGTTDEDESIPAVVTDAADTRPSPMADLPKGATFGSLVHAVLEEVDVTAEDLPAQIEARVREQLDLWTVEMDVATAVTAFEAILTTPLGPLAADLDLLTLLREHQLKELDFEIPMGGGDHPVAGLARLGDLADVLDAHLTSDDPLRPFAARLRSPALADQPLRGYLTGSIDLVLRLPTGGFLVVDHKTNWLGPTDVPLTIAGYRPDALAEAMNAGTYPLQALLYSVVLHRFLRWRVRDYDPERHLGGVLYLYLRGMAGPDAPRYGDVPYGVFSWRPPASLVLALSELLDGTGASR